MPVELAPESAGGGRRRPPPVNTQMKLISNHPAFPQIWNLVQDVLGAPRFKEELYRSKLTPPGRLLDFGCANGHISDAFRGFEYYGVDLDLAAIAAAKGRYSDRADMHFLAADLRTAPVSRRFLR